ncbi:Tim44 domain-containing protein [Noviherbaspirillum sp.]|uniref:Tim44 domain-containing protein n=1 Tax=Noviherbaspirillum sp. TaxID=1926288 RepID=UPI002B49E893|nr:TIM44-like domain-containing protein [Noviherbaspirillum sp.]HJV83505.1 TIM44-like domain-containing protein [Noviherbaspirillum sp.]
MKKFLIALVVILGAMAVVASDAEARRLGGGGSFGRQAPSYSRQAPSQSPGQFSNSNQAKPSSPASAPQNGIPPRPASPWRNMLGGALLGLGLGALLSHFGLGGVMASMIGTILMFALIAVGVVFVMRLFRNKSGHDVQPAYAGGYSGPRTPEIGSRLEPQIQPAAFQAEPVSSNVSSLPSDFDAPAFLRHAKTYFIRLQAAWDKADINDIREFTTPEMFAELRLQLQERGASPNHTDVVSLEAELLGMERTGDEYMASVKFSGMIKEADNAPAEPFAEIWNLTKPVSGQGGWVMAGIQQLS